jgi:hypothetical protein
MDFDIFHIGEAPLGSDMRPIPGPTRTLSTDRLERDIERLRMICEAMWRILKDKLGVDDEELVARIAEIDLMDGEADGRKAPKGPAMCPKCNRPNSRRHDFCIYCGAFIRTRPFD